MQSKRVHFSGVIALLPAPGGAFSGTAGEAADSQLDNSRARHVIVGAVWVPVAESGRSAKRCPVLSTKPKAPSSATARTRSSASEREFRR